MSFHQVAPDNTGPWEEKIVGYSLLDELMGQIPGKDGYNCSLKDNGLDGYTAKVGTNNKYALPHMLHDIVATTKYN